MYLLSYLGSSPLKHCHQTAASLKRKRCDTEDDAADTGIEGGVDERRVIRSTKRRKTMEVVSMVVHTAAVAGVGAVAAWAALAFS